MCASVCLSVREDISGTARAIFTKFIVHVAYVRGSVLLWHVDDRSHCLSAGRDDASAQRGRSVIYDCLDNNGSLWLVCTVSSFSVTAHTTARLYFVSFTVVSIFSVFPTL